MCGIIGYVGKRDAASILLEGLKKLEYRGYDSSGIGVVSGQAGQICVRKMQGKIQALETLLSKQPLPSSTVGISHTRWATHGAPNRRNAHPHFDGSKQILVVHNGIIENYEQLKAGLIKRGHRFVSETDTEVIAHVIQSCYNGDIEDAVLKAVRQLRGAFALGVLSRAEPDRMIAVRIGSPLIIGLGEGENFIASDVPAVIDATRRVIYLKDGEMAVMTKDGVQVRTFAGDRVFPKVHQVTFNVDAVQKQGYAHFMLKEIHEQPDVLARMWKSRLHQGEVVLDGLNLSDAQLKRLNKLIIIACGTAYHAGLVGKYCVEKFARLSVSVDAASEFRYCDPILDARTLVVAISQSGETADTLAAVKEAKARGARVVSICNVVGSSLARESHGVLYTHAGPEIGVASTKAYTAQIAMVYLLALKLAQVRGTLGESALKKLAKEMSRVPHLYDEILKKKRSVAAIAKKNSHFGCFLFLGRNINYPSAMEGALKLKEISYIPAEGYPAGEMKHGPIALIDEYRAVVCICPRSAVYEKMISNIQEIRARKGKIIAIATDGDKDIARHVNHVITVPDIEPVLSPLLVALPLQLLAYYISVRLGCDVDQPRNLAKSVTVE